MEKVSKNGKTLRNICLLIQKTGQGVRMAADTGYKTGYFMAKHPNIEQARKEIQKNYKAGLIALLGLTIGILGLLNILMRKR